MLRNFHYIDEKGKDEGANSSFSLLALSLAVETLSNVCHVVRNRAREICELLGDVEKIRAERRKAKANKNKFVGTGNDEMSFSSDGSRFGGFGNDSFGNGYDRGASSCVSSLLLATHLQRLWRR